MTSVMPHVRPGVVLSVEHNTGVVVLTNGRGTVLVRTGSAIRSFAGASKFARSVARVAGLKTRLPKGRKPESWTHTVRTVLY